MKDKISCHSKYLISKNVKILGQAWQPRDTTYRKSIYTTFIYDTLSCLKYIGLVYRSMIHKLLICKKWYVKDIIIHTANITWTRSNHKQTRKDQTQISHHQCFHLHLHSLLKHRYQYMAIFLHSLRGQGS